MDSSDGNDGIEVPSGTEKELRIKCLICLNRIEVSKLEQHIYGKHVGECGTLFSCVTCKKTSSDKGLLMKHAMDANHIPLRLSEERNPYVDRLVQNIINDCLRSGKKQISGKESDQKPQLAESSEVKTKVKTKLESRPVVETPKTTKPGKKKVVEESSSTSSDSSDDERTEVESSAPRKKTTLSSHKKQDANTEASNSKYVDQPKTPYADDDSGGGKKICKLCTGARVAIPRGTVNFFHHVSKNHMKIGFSCSFCNKRKSSTEGLEQHVRERHPGKTFSVLMIKEKVELKKKVNECFFPPTGILTKKRKSAPQDSDDNVEDDTTLKKSGKLDAEPVKTSERKDREPARKPIEFFADPAIPSISRVQEMAESHVECYQCGQVIQNSSTAKNQHVVHEHLKIRDKNPVSCLNTSLGSYQYRHCFPEDQPNVCSLCSKVISSETGKKSHVAAVHSQVPLQCNFCPRQETVTYLMTRHCKEKHPSLVPVNYRFEAPQHYMDAQAEKFREAFPTRRFPPYPLSSDTSRNNRIPNPFNDDVNPFRKGSSRNQERVSNQEVSKDKHGLQNVFESISGKFPDPLAAQRNQNSDGAKSILPPQSMETSARKETESPKTPHVSHRSQGLLFPPKAIPNVSSRLPLIPNPPCSVSLKVLNKEKAVSVPKQSAIVAPLSNGAKSPALDEIQTGLTQAVDFGEVPIPTIASQVRTDSEDPDDDDIVLLDEIQGKSPIRPPQSNPKTTSFWGPPEGASTPQGPSTVGAPDISGHSVQGTMNVKKEKVLCQSCRAELDNGVAAMLEHVWIAHVQIKTPPFECLRCSYRHYVPANFVNHYKITHNQDVGDSDRLFRQTTSMQARFSFQQELKRCFNVPQNLNVQP